jgi:1-acyl-sn-glycerol-3-phosphate acyltransferase
MKTLMRKIGEIPASHEHAAEALDAGAAVLVYPGGAHEAFRPWSDRNRIDFGGHKGFVRLALRKQVPVVPVVGHGGHETTIVLTRGEWLARRLGMERLRLHIAPMLLQVPWGLSLPILPGIPLPAKITVEICPPPDWSQLGPEAADDPAIVERCYGEVTASMQSALTRLAEERPSPVLSRLWRLLPGGGSDQSAG